MRKLIREGQNDSMQIRNANVTNISFNVLGTHGTVNTSLSAGWLDTAKIDVKAILTRDGEQMTILSGTLETFLREGYQYDHRYDLIDSSTGTILVLKGAAVKEQGLLPFDIDLGGIINLRDSDVLEVSMNWHSGALAAAMDSALSYIEIGYKEGIGLEFVTPTIQVLAIASEQNEFRKGLGSNVQSIMLINTDATTNYSTDQVIKTMVMDSDKVKENVNYNDLHQRRLRKFPTKTMADGRLQSHILHDGPVELDNVNVELTLESGNVATGKNFLVYRQYKMNRRKVAWARAKREKHQRQLSAKFATAPQRTR
jgi:hypothetical protein